MPLPDRAEAFEALYRRHCDAVRRYAQRRVDLDDVEEIVSQTFEAMWRNLERVPVGAEESWLYGTARRMVANQRRGETRRRRLIERVQALTPRSADAGDANESYVQEALARLGHRDRELLLLMAWEGLERDELARALGVSRAVLRLRVHRARKRFAVELGERGREPRVASTHAINAPRSTDA